MSGPAKELLVRNYRTPLGPVRRTVRVFLKDRGFITTKHVGMKVSPQFIKALNAEIERLILKAAARVLARKQTTLRDHDV